MRQGMRLGTRLLLPLLATVVAVMALATWRSQHQRETTLTEEARRETNAYAVALGLALEAAARSGSEREMQAIIDRISQEPTIYGVVVYDTAARVRLVSQTVDTLRTAPLQSVQKVLASGQREVLLRDFEGERVYSVVRALREGDAIVGAIEVAQTLAFVEAEKRFTRERYVVNAALLMVAMTVLILWLVQRQVATPLGRLVTGVRALGSGELAHRIDARVGPGELGELAREFNHMADRLEAARTRLEREAEERLALERRLRETEKMAALGTLAAGLAHEIAAPLHVIRGRAEMLLKREQEPAAERNLRIISGQIERITHIVRNLLDYARRREPQMGTVPVSRLLDELLEFLAAEISADDVEIVRTGAFDAAVYGDADLLHQVFINLLLNALQALRGRQQARRIRLDVATSATGSVSIEVEDNAGGIDEHMLQLVFDPFVTTKPAESGTGLGLAVARSIVEEHGGRIEAFNRERDGERGAVLRVTLPAAQPAEVP